MSGGPFSGGQVSRCGYPDTVTLCLYYINWTTSGHATLLMSLHVDAFISAFYFIMSRILIILSSMLRF